MDFIYKKSGFGLMGLLITVAIISFAVFYEYKNMLKPDINGKTKIEQDMGAIDAAKNVKNIVESRNKIQVSE